MSQKFKGKVKNVLSGETINILYVNPQKKILEERHLTLSYVKSEDSFESKEYLRQNVIGSTIRFTVYNSANQLGKEFGDFETQDIKSMTVHLLEKGMVKLKPNLQRENIDIYNKLWGSENIAKKQSLGLWGSMEPIEIVPLNKIMIEKSCQKPYKVIIDNVLNAGVLFGRIIINKNRHVVTRMFLAGIQSYNLNDLPEENQNELNNIIQKAKKFVEDKFLTTNKELTISIIGESKNKTPVCMIYHPSKNIIQEKLVENGLVKIFNSNTNEIDVSFMFKLRNLELEAKKKKLNFFLIKSVDFPTTNKVNKTQVLSLGSVFRNVKVEKVISGDTIVVTLENSNNLIDVQFASIKSSKSSFVKTFSEQEVEAMLKTSREFLRSNLIGKTGTMFIEGFKPENKEHGIKPKYLISFKLNNTDVSELIVKNGMGTVIKHSKNSINEKSLNYDNLVQLEEHQKKLGHNGFYYTGDNLADKLIVNTRIIDASENNIKSRSFLNNFKKNGNISGYHVENIFSLTKVKLFNPKESIKLTLILGGLTNDKSQSILEGLDFMNKHLYQRNVEFSVYGVDKFGAYIGNLFLKTNSPTCFQVKLLKQGFIKLHDYSVRLNPLCDLLVEAENVAKSLKKNIWLNYIPEQETKDLKTSYNVINSDLKLKKVHTEIQIVDIDPSGLIYFHFMDPKTKLDFQEFKNQFNNFHLEPKQNLTSRPKINDYVSAKFGENNKYYRAKILSYDKKNNLYTVRHLDFGNLDNVSLESLRPLPSQFSLQKYPSFAKLLFLNYIKFPPSNLNHYLLDSIKYLEETLYDIKLILELYDNQTNHLQYNSVLFKLDELHDFEKSINYLLLTQGLAFVDTKKYSYSDTEYIEKSIEAQNLAKSKHLGLWEYGDSLPVSDIL